MAITILSSHQSWPETFRLSSLSLKASSSSETVSVSDSTPTVFCFSPEENVTVPFLAV